MDIQSGLSPREAERLLEQHGPNELSQEKKSRLRQIIIDQFKDYMVLVLIAAAVISALMYQFTEAISILVIVLANALLGIIQSYRTEKALDSLKAMSAPTARVRRGGREQTIPSSLLVPGDILVLSPGDRIGADGTLLESAEMSCDESMLTGESVPAKKAGGQNRVYMGTMVMTGHGVARVAATGMETEMGKIAGMLKDASNELTPLQKRLKSLGKTILACCLIICAGVSVTGVIRGESILDMALSGISLAVAAIPEGLPAVVTVSLAMGISRMSRRAAIIRRLPAVETLGCVDVICSDKTGTLTENKMTVTDIYCSGEHYSLENGKKPPKGAGELFRAAALCTNVKVEGKGPKAKITGEPTESAIAAAALALLPEPYTEGAGERVHENPFSSERKRMSVVYRQGERQISYVKGAPEILLPRCTMLYIDGRAQDMSGADASAIRAAAAKMAAGALRVLAAAYRPRADETGAESAESGLVFLGLIGMLDPPRQEAGAAVMECVRAGIRPVMITGDHRDTAVAIAQRLKISRRGDRILTGEDMDKMSDDELERVSAETAVYARVSPKHKFRIVQALKRQGLVTAMTGDGVNDAPAVREADIGIAMGKSGTDVTREASEIVLADDNFASIVDAVRQGRMIYDNIRKFIRYMLSSNLGEVLTMFGAMLFVLPLPLLPAHILLVNLVTDGLPAMALSVDPPDGDVMSRPPRGRGESVFAGGLGLHILLRGFFIGLSTIGIFWYSLKTGHGLGIARTAAFFTLAASQLVFVFECRSEKRGMFSRRILENKLLVAAVLISFGVMSAAIHLPGLARLFALEPMPAAVLLPALGISAAGALISSLITLFTRRARGKRDRAGKKQDGEKAAVRVSKPA